MSIFNNSFKLNDQRTTPVLVDIVANDMETSLLPPSIRFLFKVNPRTMQLAYQKVTTRKQSYGGFVEFHWGDGLNEITFENASGAFMRMYTGLTGIQNNSGQGRRQTLSYDAMLDYLALFHNNGAIYDSRGNLAQQTYVKLTFEPGIYIGWFNGEFPITQTAEQPFQFTFSSRFIIHKEVMRFRSTSNFNAQFGVSENIEEGSSTIL